MEIEWRTISEAPDYEISSDGRVRRVVADWQGKYRGRIIRPRFVRGYARVGLRVNGQPISRSVHRLVCEAFNGPRPPEKEHCAHRDGNKDNNRPGNLYWATVQENINDRERHGRTHRGPLPPNSAARIPRGDAHWMRKHPERIKRGAEHWRTGTKGRGAKGEQMAEAKLTEEDVREIFLTPKRHGSGKTLAERFDVSMGLICHIRGGRAWAHVTDPLR